MCVSIDIPQLVRHNIKSILIFIRCDTNISYNPSESDVQT